MKRLSSERRSGRLLPCRPRRAGGTCPHGRPVACNERHHADDPRTGTPVCADCYDYTGAVLFNATAPKDVRFHQFEKGTGRRIRYRRVTETEPEEQPPLEPGPEPESDNEE